MELTSLVMIMALSAAFNEVPAAIIPPKQAKDCAPPEWFYDPVTKNCAPCSDPCMNADIQGTTEKCKNQCGGWIPAIKTAIESSTTNSSAIESSTTNSPTVDAPEAMSKAVLTGIIIAIGVALFIAFAVFIKCRRSIMDHLCSTTANVENPDVPEVERVRLNPDDIGRGDNEEQEAQTEDEGTEVHQPMTDPANETRQYAMG